jgi:hypothetical protein
MHLDVHYVYMHTNNYELRKVKTNLQLYSLISNYYFFWLFYMHSFYYVYLGAYQNVCI